MRVLRIASIRGRLVVWYLAVLAILLVALGVAQSILLSSYLISQQGRGMRQAAASELAVLGPCFVSSAAKLDLHAQTLARLLGARDTAVKIVSPIGETLADHGFGPPGHTRPLTLSAATIASLILQAEPPASPSASGLKVPSCKELAEQPQPQDSSHDTSHLSMRSGDLLLMALPLGPPQTPVGYAILGHSLYAANATLNRVRIVFGLGALIALVLAAVVALPIINRALRPLRRVAETAEAIAGGDLQQRADLAVSSDEVGRLGRAFDVMVDHLMQALTSATESEERMRQFLADASHELRTPLTALRGTADVLLRQGPSDDPEVDAGLVAIHEETVRLSRLVNDLLTLSRIDTGQESQPLSVALRPFLEDFVARYGMAWPDRTIDVDLDAVDGATALVDRDALVRILTNLVDNATRYSRAEAPVTLSVAERDGMVDVAVQDEGPGLSAEDAGHMFDRFYRGSRSRSRRSGGSGLGLAIVQALVQQSRGKISVETAPDTGTRVTVTLPQGRDTDQ